MLCPECKKDLPLIDFIKGQELCYKCSYAFKTKKPECSAKKAILLCKTCGKELAFIENAKKRQRNIYCSKECAQIGHKSINNNYWTRKLREDLKLNPQYYA